MRSRLTVQILRTAQLHEQAALWFMQLYLSLVSIAIKTGFSRAVMTMNALYLEAVPRSHFFAGICQQIFRDVFPKMDSLEQSLLAPVSFAPKTDMYEQDDKVLLEMEAPGIREEAINLSVERNTLTISGERKQNEERKKRRYQRVERYYGSFSRTFALPAMVDTNRIRASYEHGFCIFRCRRRLMPDVRHRLLFRHVFLPIAFRRSAHPTRSDLAPSVGPRKASGHFRDPPNFR